MATRQLGHNQTEPGAEGFVRIEPSSVRPPAETHWRIVLRGYATLAMLAILGDFLGILLVLAGHLGGHVGHLAPVRWPTWQASRRGRENFSRLGEHSASTMARFCRWRFGACLVCFVKNDRAGRHLGILETVSKNRWQEFFDAGRGDLANAL